MKWVGGPDNAVVYIETAPLYPSVGPDDDLTQALDEWVDTSPLCIVTDLIDNDEA